MTELPNHAQLSVVLWPPSDTAIHTDGHAIGWQRPAQGFKESRCCDASIRQKDARREAGSRPGEAEVDFPPGEVKAGPGTGRQIQDMVLAQSRTRRKQMKGRSGASTSAGAT